MITLLTWHQVLAFGLAAFVVIAVPGPSLLFVIGRALSYGRRTALASVVGNTLGFFVVMSLVAVGLGAVVARSAVLFTVLKFAGAAYVVWLGVQAIRHRRAIDVDGTAAAAAQPVPTLTAVRQGFVVGISNPKGFMLFAALLPQFLDQHGPPPALQMFLLGLIAVIIGLVSDSVWALGASGLRHWFAASPERTRRLGLIGGVSMIGLGIGIAATGRPT